MSRHLTFTIILAAAMSIMQASQAANPELVDIAKIDPTIVIDLRYATEHNVTGHALYPPGMRALILPSVAQKDQYVANPERGFGSMHSYGVSVDATLVDDWSQDASMPTKFDEFTPEAMLRYTGRDPLVKQHLTLLQVAMSRNNFYGLRVEWWHFTTADWKKYVPYWEDKQMSQTGESPSPKS